MIRLHNLLNEYTDKQKQAMGIPNGAAARGGKWYIGDKYAGKVVDGKFVTAQQEPEPAPSSSPSNNVTGVRAGKSSVPTPKKQSKISQQPEPSTTPKYVASPTALTLGQKISEQFQEMASPSDLASVVTQAFGRTKPVKTRTKSFLEKLKEKVKHKGIEVMGFYDPGSDTIVLENNTPVKTDIRQPSYDQAEALHVQIHESIHAASPRLQGIKELKNPIDRMIEEGLTEALTRNTTYYMGKTQEATNFLSVESPYLEFEKAVRYLAIKGETTLDEMFKIKTSDELRTRIMDLSKTVITKQLSIAFSEKQTQIITDLFKPAAKKHEEHGADWGVAIFSKKILDVVSSITPTGKNQPRILRALGMDDNEIKQIQQAGDSV